MIKKYDFVKRSRENLTKITSLLSNHRSTDNKEPTLFYHVTNLINNCLGLITYVYQYAEDEANVRHQINSTISINNFIGDILKEIFQNVSYDRNKYGEIVECHPKWGNTNASCIDTEAIVYRLRNAICHNNLTFNSEDHGNGKKFIKSIHFYSVNNHGNVVFDATMTIKQLKMFVLDVSDAYLEYYKNHNINSNSSKQ